jgi:N-acetylglucosamine-6-phosphate deacetylase
MSLQLSAKAEYGKAPGAEMGRTRFAGGGILLLRACSCDDASMQKIVVASWLWTEAGIQPEPMIVVEEGRITAIASRRDCELPTGAEILDYTGSMLAPAFLDVHIHGCAGHDVMEGSSDALLAISRFLGQRGTGSFLATTVTAPLDVTRKALSELAKRLGQSREWPGAIPCGIHLEGPFLSHAKRGVHPLKDLREPSMEIFDQLFDAADGMVRLMTVAPELPGAEALALHATQRGVRVSMGHSNATAAEAERLLHAGATSATHTFNAMRALDHREPGIAGVVLSEASLFAELICDGIHVDPRMVQLWWRLKGSQRGILVTDAMAATGMPDGEYRLGEMPVQVANGRATANGVLAGSVLTMDQALKNMIAYTGASLVELLPLLTRNPAQMIGVEERVCLGPGKRADMVALADDGRLIASLVAGVPVPAG